MEKLNFFSYIKKLFLLVFLSFIVGNIFSLTSNFSSWRWLNHAVDEQNDFEENFEVFSVPDGIEFSNIQAKLNNDGVIVVSAMLANRSEYELVRPAVQLSFYVESLRFMDCTRSLKIDSVKKQEIIPIEVSCSEFRHEKNEKIPNSINYQLKFYKAYRKKIRYKLS